jgi:hypothetical protein
MLSKPAVGVFANSFCRIVVGYKPWPRDGSPPGFEQRCPRVFDDAQATSTLMPGRGTDNPDIGSHLTDDTFQDVSDLLHLLYACLQQWQCPIRPASRIAIQLCNS